MKEVIVLLSAYNGSKYIIEQLDSIVNQESVRVKLIIRDDGSTDDTYSKINSFKEIHNTAEIIILKGENVGYVKSFYLLTKFALERFPDIQYFSFSDQDDFWAPEKLISALNCIPDKVYIPILYCSNAMMTDKNLKPIGLFNTGKYNISPQTCLIQNIVIGCTTLFNKKAAQLFVDHQIANIVVHDQYLYILCTLLGVTIYDENSHILYRQHNNNQIGKPKAYQRIFTSIKRLFSHSHSLEERAKLIYEEFKDVLYGDSLAAIKKLALYRKSMRNKISLLFDSNFKYDSQLSNILFRLKIIIGRV